MLRIITLRADKTNLGKKLTLGVKFGLRPPPLVGNAKLEEFERVKSF